MKIKWTFSLRRPRIWGVFILKHVFVSTIYVLIKRVCDYIQNTFNLLSECEENCDITFTNIIIAGMHQTWWQIKYNVKAIRVMPLEFFC
jgi:hypothetical protein